MTKIKNLTKKQARVAIANDVLKLLNSRHLKVASSNGYLVVKDNTDIKDIVGDNMLCDAQPSINKLVKNCEVCALGSAMVSYVRLFDNITLRELGIHNSFWDKDEIIIETDKIDISEKLGDIFSLEQLDMIEAAFERDSTFADYEDKGDSFHNKINKSLLFGEKYKSDRQRLIAIMQNIVDNDGTFKP